MTPAQLQALAGEIAGEAYAGLSAAEAAAALNAVTVPARVAVSKKKLRSALQVLGVWGGVRLAAEGRIDGAPIEVQGAAITVVDALMSDNDEIEMNIPEVDAAVDTALGALVAAQLMTAEQKTAILALGDGYTARAAQLGLPRVEPSHIEAARAI